MLTKISLSTRFIHVIPPLSPALFGDRSKHRGALPRIVGRHKERPRSAGDFVEPIENGTPIPVVHTTFDRSTGEKQMAILRVNVRSTDVSRLTCVCVCVCTCVVGDGKDARSDTAITLRASGFIDYTSHKCGGNRWAGRVDKSAVPR